MQHRQLSVPGLPSVRADGGPARSLSDALDGVADYARNSGLAARTVRGAYEAPARSVLRYLDGDLSLRDIDADMLSLFVRRCLADGLAAATVRRSYLRVLRLAFMNAGFSIEGNPVHHVLRHMRQALRVKRPLLIYFEPDELHDVLKRIATFRPESGKRLRRLPRDLAVFRLVAFRGLRTGELDRIEISRDVDLKAKTLLIESKYITEPRVVHLSPELLRDVITLCAARHSGPLIEGGERTLNAMCERWKARLHEPRLNLRVLRRSFGTGLDAAGAPYASIQAAMGHVPGSAATLRYLGEVRRETDAALKRLEHRSPPGRPGPQRRDDGLQAKP